MVFEPDASVDHHSDGVRSRGPVSWLVTAACLWKPSKRPHGGFISVTEHDVVADERVGVGEVVEAVGVDELGS